MWTFIVHIVVPGRVFTPTTEVLLHRRDFYLQDKTRQDGRPGLWLAVTFSTSPLKLLNGIQRNLSGSKISTSSTKFVFWGRSEKQDGRPDLWSAETFSTSPLKRSNEIQRNLTGSKISTSSTKIVFFGSIGPSRFHKKVAHCTRVHNMWPFGPFVSFKVLWRSIQRFFENMS